MQEMHDFEGLCLHGTDRHIHTIVTSKLLVIVLPYVPFRQAGESFQIRKQIDLLPMKNVITFKYLKMFTHFSEHELSRG